MHVITVTRRTAATPEAIWRLWADVPNRTRWDDALERITLEGPFQSAAQAGQDGGAHGAGGAARGPGRPAGPGAWAGAAGPWDDRSRSSPSARTA
jgi:hypothetical protein